MTSKNLLRSVRISLFVAVFALSTIAHEMGHFLVALQYGRDPEVGLCLNVFGLSAYVHFARMESFWPFLLLHLGGLLSLVAVPLVYLGFSSRLTFWWTFVFFFYSFFETLGGCMNFLGVSVSIQLLVSAGMVGLFTSLAYYSDEIKNIFHRRGR